MVNRVDRYKARDGEVFESLEEAIAHEDALPDAALRVELKELVDVHTERYEGVDADSFIDALLEQYNVEKKPAPFTGELRHR